MAASQKSAKMIMLINTTLAPVGVAYIYEITTPIKKHSMEIMAEHTVTLLNFFNKRMELRAGKIIKLDINITPINLIPSTMVRAVNNAISIL